MKKILCLTVMVVVMVSLIFPVISHADSPVTSTPFYTAYLDIEQVIKASEMCCIDEETAEYLSNPEHPIEVKAAIINAIGWEIKNGSCIEQTDEETCFKDNSKMTCHNISGKNNAERYSHFIFEKPLSDLDLDAIPAHDLFCIGYFMVMDRYSEPERAVALLEKASAAIPDSYTVAMITAIAKAQVAFGNINEWNKVWELVNDVIQNKNLEQDMRAGAVDKILDYMILYKGYNDTEVFIHPEQSAAVPGLITDKPITLTYFKALLGSAEGVDENLHDAEFYKELEKRTNITLSFIHVAEEVMVQKLMLMTAAGDTPDLIEFPWQRYEGLIENMADMSAIIELDELINNVAPNLHSMLQSNPEVKRQMTSDDGHIYQIPGINLSDGMVTTGPVIRGDLLKKYGLDVPETIDDWEQMLIEIRDGGERTIPLSFDMSVFKDSGSFISAFGIPYGFGVRDGKVFYGPIEESYKDFLTTFNRWYQKGLIDPEFLLLRNTQLKDRVNRGEVGTFIGEADHLKDSMDTLKSIDSSFELLPVQNPVHRNVDTLIVRPGVPTMTECGIAISSRNTYPEESMKWMDYAYSEQAMNITLRPRPEVPGYTIDEKEYIYPEQKEAVRLWSVSYGEKNPSSMPPVSLTQEESNELSTIMDNLSVYKEEMFAKYVLGAASLDHFDEYVKTAKKLGIGRAIEIMQAAHDRCNNRLSVLKINGETIETDTEPVIITEGEILLPVRFVTEGLGGSVAWNEKNKIVTGVWGDTVFSFQLNTTEAMVNYEPKTLDLEIRAINQRTYVPAGFIQEVLDVTVHWDKDTRTVDIIGD